MPDGLLRPMVAPSRFTVPDLRKACHWLEMAKRDGHDLGTVIDQSHALPCRRGSKCNSSLIRNVTILARLGCLDEAEMLKLRKGLAPTITKGPYAGEIVTGDHITK